MNINNNVFVVVPPPPPGFRRDEEKATATWQCLDAYIKSSGVGFVSISDDDGTQFAEGDGSTLLMRILTPEPRGNCVHTHTTFPLPSKNKDAIPEHARVMGLLFTEWVQSSARGFLWALIESVIGINDERVYYVCTVGNPDHAARRTVAFKLIQQLVYSQDKRFGILD